MRHAITEDQFRAIVTALDSRFVVSFAGGAVRFLGRSLPGDMVCALLPTQEDGVLRVAYDPNKPNALAHTQAMVCRWWESYQEPVVYPNGTVDFAPRTSPDADDAQVELTSAV